MNNLNVNKILLRRKQQIVTVDLISEECNNDLKSYISVLNQNLAQLGYRLSYKLMYYLLRTSGTYILEVQDFLINNINKLIGNADNMDPLFSDFPNVVLSMDQVSIGLFNTLYAEFEFDKEKLDSALKEFGIEKKESYKTQINKNLKVIDIAFEKDILDLAKNIINSKTAYSQQDKEDIDTLLNEDFSNVLYMLPESINFKENLVYITKLLLNKDIEPKEFSHLYKTYTDVLRLAVALSDEDISLAENAYFKNFTRKERRMLLELFNNCKINPEDMLRHKQMYLRLGEKIHPGEYRKKYPKAFKSFDMLRNDEKEIKKTTFNHKKEYLFSDKNVDNLITLLKTRPGEYARSLNRLLVLGQELDDSFYTKIIDEFINVADNIPVSTLLVLEDYFTYRVDDKSDRIFYPKGQIAKVYGIENNLTPLNAMICSYASIAIQDKIIDILSEKDPLGKVYIDKDLENYVAPLKMRDASKTLKPLERGSKFNIDNDNIRIFLHWLDGNSRTDLDLSIILYDKDFNRKYYLYYGSNDLKIDGCVHSGDVRRAPAPIGGTEYIDINLNTLKDKKPDYEYIAVCVHSFTSQPFYELPECFIGYMDNDVELTTAYNPSYVKFKSDITTDQGIAFPYLISISKKELTWCDIGTDNSSEVNNIRSAKGKTDMILKNILNTHKPRMNKLASLNAVARGKIVSNISEADIIFTDKKDELLDTADIIRYKEVEKERIMLDEEGNEISEKYIDVETYNATIVTPFDTDIIASDLL